MKPIDMDKHEAFEQVVGIDRGFRLMRLWENTHEGSAYDKTFNRNYKSKTERFITSAQRDGYKLKEIEMFLDLQ